MPAGPDRRRRPGRRALARPRRGAPAARAVRAGQPAGLAARPGGAPDRPAADRRGPPRRASRSAPAAPARAACAFGNGATLPVAPGEPADAAVRLEIDRWNGAVSPKLVLRRAQPCAPRADRRDRRARTFAAGLLRELDRDLAGGRASRPPRGARRIAAPADGGAHGTRDLRGTGIAGLLGDLVATGEPVLAVAAHAPHRARVLAERVGGFALTSLGGARGRPGLARPVHPRRRHRPADTPARTIRTGRDGPTWRGVRLN